MRRGELQALAARVLREARAVRTAYPAVAAMGAVPATPVRGEPPADVPALLLWAALDYLREELAVVRDGRAGSPAVLDDEIAHVQARLGRL